LAECYLGEYVDDDVGGTCSMHGSYDKYIYIYIIVGKGEKKKPLQSNKNRYEINIKWILNK